MTLPGTNGTARHGHAHDRLPAASRHTRRVMTAVLAPAALLTIVAMIALWPARPHRGAGSGDDGRRANGTVISVTEQSCPAGTAAGQACGSATVHVEHGPGAGSDVAVDLPSGPGAPRLRVGDEVVLLYLPGAVPGGHAYTVVDHQRGRPLIWLIALTAVVILAFGRWRGLTSLAGLALSFTILLLFIVPAILDGSPPLLVAVVGSAAIMFAALYLTHGLNVHTSVAVAGTLASLVLTGVLGVAFTAALHLSGVATDEDSFLASIPGSIDMRGLLLAGVVIGALGVLDDVTVTQAVTVAEMAAAGPTTRWLLYRAAGRVGRAHVASAVNTIVLAYAGASLPLLLLFATGSQPLSQVLTGELLAQEILRSAVGTIGLVASVPITTALAALVADVRTGSGSPARPRHAAAAH
ncbi:YibE/F family protein [Actinoplanes sp. CA-030573]|uniref:YibE/F family protein n=1 Tax=Actinoplanes sp. CA-030573 TaxID=3239898 RepID=UPI003D8AAC86